MNSQQIINSWEKNLNNANLNKLINLYAEDAVLWGTFSNIIRNNTDLIREYFQNLFKKKELKVCFITSNNRVYESANLYSGTYEFSYMDQDLIKITARYTFVICKDSRQEYKIVEHHSSVIPS